MTELVGLETWWCFSPSKTPQRPFSGYFSTLTPSFDAHWASAFWQQQQTALITTTSTRLHHQCHLVGYKEFLKKNLCRWIAETSTMSITNVAKQMFFHFSYQYDFRLINFYDQLILSFEQIFKHYCVLQLSRNMPSAL